MFVLNQVSVPSQVSGSDNASANYQLPDVDNDIATDQVPHIAPVPAQMHDCGTGMKKFLNFLDENGISLNKNNGIFGKAHVETRGRTALLSDNELKVTVGFCYRMVKDKNILNPTKLTKFVNLTFGISASREWGRLFLPSEKFSKKKAIQRQSGYEFDTDESVSIMNTWLDDIFHLHIKDADLSKIISLDFTYSRYPSEINISWSPTGSKQPQKKTRLYAVYELLRNCMLGKWK